jgi:hypothetical protein
MTGHSQEAASLHRLSQFQKIQDRENARRKRLADSVSGKLAFLEQQNLESESGKQVAHGASGWTGAGYNDIGPCSHASNPTRWLRDLAKGSEQHREQIARWLGSPTP